MELNVLSHGARSEQARMVSVAVGKRLRARGLGTYAVPERDMVSLDLLLAVRKAAWALGARTETFERITRERMIPIGVSRMVLNPGKRTAEQKRIGLARVAQMRRDRDEREQAKGKRAEVVKLAQKAAVNYRLEPLAYHYLAGGKPNLVYLKPTPRDWRSDCSQFIASIYKDAGLPSPASVDHIWASTYTMVKSPRARVTTKPRPGDLGMYGSYTAPYHVELYCAEPGEEFIGHGSPPIDSITPGRPDFYLTFDFLD